MSVQAQGVFAVRKARERHAALNHMLLTAGLGYMPDITVDTRCAPPPAVPPRKRPAVPLFFECYMLPSVPPSVPVACCLPHAGCRMVCSSQTDSFQRHAASEGWSMQTCGIRPGGAATPHPYSHMPTPSQPPPRLAPPPYVSRDLLGYQVGMNAATARAQSDARQLPAAQLQSAHPLLGRAADTIMAH